MWKFVKKFKNRNKKKPSELSKSIHNMIKTSLNTTHNAFIKDAGAGVEFECETTATRSIFKMFPRATYRWTLNDGPLTMEPERMVFRMGDLVIQGLKATDTGLYSCRLHYTERKVLTVGVYSLYVRADYGATQVTDGRAIHLQCHAHLLGVLYSGSVKDWFLNGKVTSLHKISAKREHSDVIKKASAKWEGNWTCVVYNPFNEKNWTTAFYNIKVLPSPKGLALIFDYVKHNVKKTILMICGFFCFVMVISSIFIDMVEKKRKKQEKIASKIEHKLLENSGCGFYDNNGNFCYTDKEGNVVVCKDSDDEGAKGATNLTAKVKNMGKAALEKTKDLIEGSTGESPESSEDDVNKNAADVSTTQTLDSFRFEDNNTLLSFVNEDTSWVYEDSEQSFTETDSFDDSYNENRPLLSSHNYHVTFR